MNKRRLITIILLFIFLFISFVNFLIIYQSTSKSTVISSLFSGKVPFNYEASISIIIESGLDFEIITPENGSVHNFNLSERISPPWEIPEYPIELSILDNNNMAVDWYYSIYNDDYDFYYNSIEFSPDITIPVRSGWNFLIVEAIHSPENSINRSVWFYVNISHSTPIINLSHNQIIYACESEEFNNYFQIIDNNNDLESLEVRIFPTSYFLIDHLIEQIQPTVFEAKIFFNAFPNRRRPIKNEIGSYNRRIEVNNEVYSDSRNVTIEVLEINNPPSIGINPNEIQQNGKIIFTHGDNQNFLAQAIASDIEDGPLSDFVLSYQNDSFFSLFEIDGSGVMNYTANNESPLGVYPLKVCVNDSAIDGLHEDLLIHCGSDGGVNTECVNFYLQITDENRAPIITFVDPDLLELNVLAEENLFFNVSAYDGDQGFINFNWLLNGYLIESNQYIFEGGYHYSDSFSYTFHCSVSGKHNLTINVSDGLEYDSYTWILNVESVSCGDTPLSGGGGGGGPSEPFCIEEWFCPEIFDCINLDEGYSKGMIKIKDYYDLYDICRQSGLNELTCGFKSTNCTDLNNCNNTPYRLLPPEIESEICHYVVEPSCFDGIKNCHSGGCEVLVDCGGPCAPCPSCFDGIKNQGEEGIDCGGPCPRPCEFEQPSILGEYLPLLYLLLAIILILLIIYAVYKILRMILVILKKKRDEDEYDERYFKIFKGDKRKKKIKSLLSKVKGGGEND